MAEANADARWIELMELLKPFHAQALATARRLARSVDDGDDLYQESLHRAFDKLPTLRDPQRFRSWFFAVLLSVHRSRARRATWKRFFSWEEAHERGFDPGGADGRKAEDERRGSARAATALGSLAAVEREAIVLFELEGFSLEEIAGLQGASLSAVKSRLARGRKRLRAYYRKRGWASSEASTSPFLGAVPLLASVPNQRLAAFSREEIGCAGQAGRRRNTEQVFQGGPTQLAQPRASEKGSQALARDTKRESGHE